jgi:hypothetical protein
MVVCRDLACYVSTGFAVDTSLNRNIKNYRPMIEKKRVTGSTTSMQKNESNTQTFDIQLERRNIFLISIL